MFEAIFALFVGFMLVQITGYIVHRIAHTKISKSLYKSHMLHHTIYTHNNFSTESYLKNSSNDFKIIFVLLFLAVNTCVILLFGLRMFTICFMLSTSIFSLIHEYLHDSFHLRHNKLSKFNFYKKLVNLHVIHHKHVKTNYGIYTFMFDKLFNTFKE